MKNVLKLISFVLFLVPSGLAFGQSTQPQTSLALTNFSTHSGSDEVRLRLLLPVKPDKSFTPELPECFERQRDSYSDPIGYFMQKGQLQVFILVVMTEHYPVVCTDVMFTGTEQIPFTTGGESTVSVISNPVQQSRTALVKKNYLLPPRNGIPERRSIETSKLETRPYAMYMVRVRYLDTDKNAASMAAEIYNSITFDYKVDKR